MISIIHLLFGAALGKLIPSLLVIPIAFASHFLLDWIPHYKFAVKFKGKKAIIDKKLILTGLEPLIGIIVGLYFVFTSQHGLYIFLGGFFSILPDIFIFLERKFNFLGKFKFLVHSGKWHKHIPFWEGIVTFLLLIIISLIILIKY